MSVTIKDCLQLPSLSLGSVIAGEKGDVYKRQEEIIVNALVLETRKYLDFTVKFNVKDLMSHILQATRVTLSEEEKKQFYDKYIKSMRLAIDDNGDVHVELNSWK